jgi:hypothetical protein
VIDRLRTEGGASLVAAVMLMSIMMGTGLAGYSYVDSQQRESSRERLSESSFNLGEGSLNTQAFILSRNWPGSAARAYPSCSNSSANSTYCPQPAQLAAGYDSADYAGGTERRWQTSVRDDSGSPFYDEAVVNARPAWDQNGNDRLWVRSEAQVRGKWRTIVALIQIEEVPESFPKSTVIAGRFKTTNKGNKIIVQTNSTATSPHPVMVRCESSTDEACMEYEEGKGQIDPDSAVQTGQYVDQRALPDDVTARLRETAENNARYYPSGQCPSDLTAPVTYIVNADSCGTFNGNITANSATEPGIVIVERGTLSFAGGFQYYGILYHLNLTDASADLIDLGGNVSIFGGIYIDGNGRLLAGSSKVNLVYLDEAFTQIRTHGAAGVVQNSWRELNDPTPLP